MSYMENIIYYIIKVIETFRLTILTLFLAFLCLVILRGIFQNCEFIMHNSDLIEFN